MYQRVLHESPTRMIWLVVWYTRYGWYGVCYGAVVVEWWYYTAAGGGLKLVIRYMLGYALSMYTMGCVFYGEYG